MEEKQGTLFIVATPIGNLADMTFRAVETLSQVDIILCEDTRTTGTLLKHYNIPNKNDEGKSKLMSFHSHSKLTKVQEIINLISEGKHLALVSDAGTPCISDPGVVLVAELQKALGDRVKMSPIPGASALISALSVAGAPVHTFTFKGFVPHKKGRETFFHEVAETPHTTVFYESVHRIEKTLASLQEVVPQHTVTITRELTKIFEEVLTGTPAYLIEYFKQHPDKVRGEFVVIVRPSGKHLA
jgi:16S rRNA (cytidine1402-2'-O)-methyltransferase